MTLLTDVLARDREAPRILGSSLRHRRLVVAGYVAFDPIALARPSMRPMEIALLTSLLKRADHVLEFGAGGSTTLALKLGVKHLDSVESDAAWIARIQADEAAARALDDHRLRLHHADIGAIGMFGGPGKESLQSQWPNYFRKPWRHIEPSMLDIVLIDGRFRVACIMESILRIERRALIAIHDFWNRPAYHQVLPFLDEIDRCETLGVFRIRPDVDRSSAERLLDQADAWPG